ncbi:MAG: cbb3-type cytochrome oxidase assembly protein CcoS [Pseudomonadota bacterium]
MNVLFILVPVSFALSALALITFLWTLRNAQYDDLDGDPCRILFDDEAPPPPPPQDAAADPKDNPPA